MRDREDWDANNRSWLRVVGVVFAVLIVGGGLYLVHRQESGRIPNAGKVIGYTPAPEQTAAAPPIRRVVAPAGTKVTFLGDSWTQGYGAKPESQGFMYRVAQAFKWKATVLGVGGSGYESTANHTSTFNQRIAALPADSGNLLIIQGSINDLRYANNFEFASRVSGTLAAALRKFPAVVAVGPCPTNVSPVDSRFFNLDDTLNARAGQLGIPYISCFRENWLDTEQVSKFLNPKLKLHPTNDGYAYLTTRLVPDLRKFVIN